MIDLLSDDTKQYVHQQMTELKHKYPYIGNIFWAGFQKSLSDTANFVMHEQVKKMRDSHREGSMHSSQIHAICPIDGRTVYYKVEVWPNGFLDADEFEKTMNMFRGINSTQENLLSNLQPSFGTEMWIRLTGRHGKAQNEIVSEGWGKRRIVKETVEKVTLGGNDGPDPWVYDPSSPNGASRQSEYDKKTSDPGKSFLQGAFDVARYQLKNIWADLALPASLRYPMLDTRYVLYRIHVEQMWHELKLPAPTFSEYEEYFKYEGGCRYYAFPFIGTVIPKCECQIFCGAGIVSPSPSEDSKNERWL